MRFQVALMLLALAVPASAQTKPVTAVLIGNGLDALTTEIALRGPSLREANPILGQSAAPRVALKAAMTAGEVLMVRWLGPSHPKLAKGLGYAIGAATTAAAVHNLTLIR